MLKRFTKRFGRAVSGKYAVSPLKKKKGKQQGSADGADGDGDGATDSALPGYDRRGNKLRGNKQPRTGTTPPLVIKYSASSIPILQLGLSSNTLS